MKQFGEDVSEQLDYVPESFKVIRHVRPKFACTACERVVEALAPSRPIERGLAGPALLAHVLVSKFCDHQPLYRQSEIYARQGVKIERSTLAGWVGASSVLLDPQVDALREHVLTWRKIHADDTPMPVLAPGTGKTKTGRLWTYVRDKRPAGEKTAPAVWFAYSEDRKGEHPRAHLKKLQGRVAGRRLLRLSSSLRHRSPAPCPQHSTTSTRNQCQRECRYVRAKQIQLYFRAKTIEVYTTFAKSAEESLLRRLCPGGRSEARGPLTSA